MEMENNMPKPLLNLFRPIGHRQQLENKFTLLILSKLMMAWWPKADQQWDRLQASWSFRRSLRK